MLAATPALAYTNRERQHALLKKQTERANKLTAGSKNKIKLKRRFVTKPGCIFAIMVAQKPGHHLRGGGRRGRSKNQFGFGLSTVHSLSKMAHLPRFSINSPLLLVYRKHWRRLTISDSTASGRCDRYTLLAHSEGSSFR